MRSFDPLPVDEVLTDLLDALDRSGTAVLDAPPGAGKSTRVPLSLLAAGAFEGRLVMLEPRRLAARAAATRMARELGETVGGAVGLVTRDERKVSHRTRIEVVTDGVLLRRLQRDPSLPDTGLLLFDEFHERRLESDLALAFALETRAALRGDLRLLVASATLDAGAVGALLGGAPVIRTEGRSFPVEVVHLGDPPPGGLVAATVSAVERAVTEDGDVLVFLPGVRELRAVARALPATPGGIDVDVRQLHGGLPPADQDSALAAAPAGRRRVVLATDVAETSLTVPGIVAVVDAGLAREPRFDVATGMSGLVTVPASRGSADQRAGRAGRLGPGRCLRLWSAIAHTRRPALPTPAIVTEDLTGAALEVACWGAEVADLALLDQPEATAWARARTTLEDLGALDLAGRPTAHGRALARLPLHPRLAHLVLVAVERGVGGLGCDLAAVLGDRDVLRSPPGGATVDLSSRVRLLRGEPAPDRATPDRGALDRARRESRRLRRVAAVAGGTDGDPDDVGGLVAAAWPDRIAVARGDRRGAFLLANGRGATLARDDLLAGEPLLAVAHVDHGHGPSRRDGASEARVFLAAAVTPEDLRDVLAAHLTEVEDARWEQGDLRAVRETRIGAVTLATAPWPDPPPEVRTAALVAGLRAEGLDLLGWAPDDRALQARLQLLHRTLGAPWSDVSDGALTADLEARVVPFLGRARRRADLRRVPVRDLLLAGGPATAARDVDVLAPTHLVVPSGSRVRLRYDPDGGRPVLAVKLQELFGATRTPTIVGGRVAVLVHLLSPAGRPVQVTDDLPSFWASGYDQVRRDLRGRYPKHPWPQDPTTATPTGRTRRP